MVSANFLRSGELARLTGVSADTLRHYERLGILPTSRRTNGGYRIFNASAVETVQLTQRALQLGFSLKELSEILRTRERGGVPCQRVLGLTEEKLRMVGEQIQELQRTEELLARTRSRLAAEADADAAGQPGRAASFTGRSAKDEGHEK